jgi:hypothetical protein
MSTLEFGPWVLLALGALTLLGALVNSFRKVPARTTWIMWIIGFAISGVSTYGPWFLGPYSDFVKTVTQLQSSPSPETYSEALQKVAEGKFSPTYDSIIVHVALSQPVDGMDSLLQLSIQKARGDEEKKILAGAQNVWTAKKAAATELSQRIAQSDQAENTLQSFDPVTKSLVARAILKRPGASTHIDPNVLRRAAVFPRQKHVP